LGQDQYGDLWIRSFLISSVPNARGWQVDPSTVRANVVSAIGKPLVIDRDPVTGRIDHPPWDSTKSAEANYRAQKRFSIGTVEKVFYDPNTDAYYADSRVTDRRAKDYISSFHGKKIPLPVSPQIIFNEHTEQPNYYRDWEFSHLAIVDKGAYGPPAKVIATCNGDGKTCHQQLQQTTATTTSGLAAASASFAGSIFGPTVPPSGKPRGKLA
jgi:hypothetical protein